MSKGVVLLNLGTPKSPEVSDVRAYLDEFLMDRYVLDVPYLLRRLIVSGFILPFRPKQSAAAYASIWGEDGSPLLSITQTLTDTVAQLLNVPCVLAMRYGMPDVASTVTTLVESGVDDLLLVPLYPHYADSTHTTSIEAVRAQLPAHAKLRVLPPFYQDPDYIEQLANSIRPHLNTQWDHLLLSYHGLPERHMTKADTTGSHCLKHPQCCETPSDAHATCYRHQIRTTTRLVTAALDLPEARVSLSFQSRLGRLPWLTPYTDFELAELPERGVKRLVVACPAFVADNLETLEEIGIRGRATFMEAGGEHLQLVPCLNAEPDWCKTLADWCKTALG